MLVHFLFKTIKRLPPRGQSIPLPQTPRYLFPQHRHLHPQRECFYNLKVVGFLILSYLIPSSN